MYVLIWQNQQMYNRWKQWGFVTEEGVRMVGSCGERLALIGFQTASLTQVVECFIDPPFSFHREAFSL